MRAFVQANTVVAAPPLLPELRLHLATDMTPLWQATERHLAEVGVEPPFWAFAWAGGQALARFLLDAPAWVRGRRVLDFASGSGLVAIAAARSGAAGVIAVDLDPLAAEAIALNAALNGVAVDVRCVDPCGALPEPAWVVEAEVVLAGDVCYDRAMAPRILAWLRRRAQAGALVLLGDPGRAYLPSEGLEALAQHRVPTPEGVEAHQETSVVVYQLR